VVKLLKIEKSHITLIVAILLIFAIGAFLRLGSAYVTGTPVDEKSFVLDENNLPYMYELDSYYNYRLTNNYLEHGYLGDVIIDGREWDMHSYAPSGVPLDYPPLIVYLTAFIYKFINLFASVPLLVVCFWLSAFIAPLAGVVAYLFTRRLTNEDGAVVAGILTVLAPFYFIRTVSGWFDTDIFIILFPLLVVWIFWEATINENPKKSLILSAAAGFIMFLFALAWNGWQYYFYLMMFFSILWVLGCYIRGKTVKDFIKVFLIFIGVTLILLTVTTGFLSLLKLLYGPLEFVKLGSQSPWTPWPDVYLSVSELAEPTFDGVMAGVGFALFGGIFGLIWTLRVLLNDKLKKTYLNSMNLFLYIFLVLWTLTGFLALFKGSRFIMIMIPPLTISTGIMVGLCVDYLDLLKNNNSSNKFLAVFRKKKYLTHILALVVILIVILPSVANVLKTLEMPPGADDDMWDSLEWINYNTPNNTVVFSNWPAGHIITSIANRPVSMDGRMAYIETVQSRNLDNAYHYGVKSPTTAREYWIDRAFYTSDENLSAGIFRMLATSGDIAYLTLDEYTKNTTRTVEILNNILGLDKAVAMDLMVNHYNLSQIQAEKILEYTHPDNPRAHVIWTYTQMVNKGFWIFNFGNWDLEKNGGENFTYAFADIQKEGNIITSTTGLILDLDNGNATYKGEIPYCVIRSNGGIENKTYLNESSNYCIVILFDESQMVVIDKRFENSMFTKMVLERVDTAKFKVQYKNNSTAVWQSV
jgi:dolichyl-diphosphooligosaccharide--protein glycosyltransferase